MLAMVMPHLKVGACKVERGGRFGWETLVGTRPGGNVCAYSEAARASECWLRGDPFRGHAAGWEAAGRAPAPAKPTPQGPVRP
jgi:hypothetical protein